MYMLSCLEIDQVDQISFLVQFPCSTATLSRPKAKPFERTYPRNVPPTSS